MSVVIAKWIYLVFSPLFEHHLLLSLHPIFDISWGGATAHYLFISVPILLIHRSLIQLELGRIQTNIVLVIHNWMRVQSVIVATRWLNKVFSARFRVYGAVEHTIYNAATGKRVVRLVKQIAFVEVEKLVHIADIVYTVYLEVIGGECGFGRRE